MSMIKAYRIENYQKWLLVGFSLVVSSLFLYAEWRSPQTHEYKKHCGHAWLIQGFKFYNDGVSSQVRNGGEISEKEFLLSYTQQPSNTFSKASVYDPIAFSVFISWLWRLCGAPSMLYLKLLSMLFFIVSTLGLVRILEFFLCNKQKAFFATLGVLAYVPLGFHVIENVRDVYHYYFFILFLYALCSFISEKRTYFFIIISALLCSLCQWIRPPLFSSVVVLTGLAFLWALFEEKYKKKIFYFLLLFWSVNIITFWIPFCVFNKHVYGEYFVSPRGEALLSGMYGITLPDGDFVEHTTGHFILRKTGHFMRCGSLESDDICMDWFKTYLEKYPLHYFKCMIKRISYMLWYDMPWRRSNPFAITQETSRWFKLQLACSSPALFFEFFIRIYLRILLVMGYIGILFAFLKKEYRLLTWLVVGVMFSSGYSWLFHIEDRVVAVHAWPLGIFAFYGLCSTYEYLYRRIRSSEWKKNDRQISVV